MIPWLAYGLAPFRLHQSATRASRVHTEMLPSWISSYVGIPFADLGRGREGLDCWGLVKLLYQDRLNLLLPDYFSYSSVSNFAEVQSTIERVRADGWERFEKSTIPAEMDVTLFNCHGRPLHVGVVVDKRYFLHAAEGDFTRLEKYRDSAWIHRLEGFYRYVR